MAAEMLEGDAPVMSDSEAVAKQQQQHQVAENSVSGQKRKADEGGAPELGYV